jgi:hypothetical protein
MPGLRIEGIRSAGVVRTAILEQGFNTTSTVSLEPKLHGGTGAADGDSDLIEVVGRVKAKLHGQKPFATRSSGFGAEHLGDQRGLSHCVQELSFSRRSRACRMRKLTTS